MPRKIIISQARQIKSGLEWCAKIDIDRKNFSLNKIFECLRIMGISPEYIRTDRTNRGWHVIFPVPTSMSDAEIIALQAICGSDKKREALNLRRHRAGVFLNLLFEPREK